MDHNRCQALTGEAESEWSGWWPGVYTASEAATLAMEDAAKKIAAEFRDIPAVKRLLQENR